jgi:surface protein
MRFIDFLNESNRKPKQLRRLSLTESKYTVQPKTTKELARIIKDYCEENGWDSDLNFIDTSLITDMSWLFSNSENCYYDLYQFNGDISQWDVSNVKTMEAMFSGAEEFDQPLNNWDVSNVKNMSEMFAYSGFNQPLDNWDVSNVKEMECMFNGAIIFNQPLNNWDVSNVENMNSMFCDAWSFNQPLDKWDVSNVKDMAGMFKGAKDFNQPLDNWDVSNVKNMKWMFVGSKLRKIFNLPEWN